MLIFVVNNYEALLNLFIIVVPFSHMEMGGGISSISY